MKKQEAILVSAFTGVLLTKDFADVHKFCEDLLGRPIWTHEFASRTVQEEIKEKCRPLIIKMIEDEADTDPQMNSLENMSIDDKIEYWHTHETGNSLREFLGMTEQEYLEFCLPKQEIKGGVE